MRNPPALKTKRAGSCHITEARVHRRPVRSQRMCLGGGPASGPLVWPPSCGNPDEARLSPLSFSWFSGGLCEEEEDEPTARRRVLLVAGHCVGGLFSQALR